MFDPDGKLQCELYFVAKTRRTVKYLNCYINHKILCTHHLFTNTFILSLSHSLVRTKLTYCRNSTTITVVTYKFERFQRFVPREISASHSEHNQNSKHNEQYWIRCLLKQKTRQRETERDKGTETEEWRERERVRKKLQQISDWKLSTYIMNVQHKCDKSHFHLSITLGEVCVWFALLKYYCFYH